MTIVNNNELSSINGGGSKLFACPTYFLVERLCKWLASLFA